MPYINKPPKKGKSDTYKERKREAQRLYQTKEWRGLREAKLQSSPMCERCGRRLSEEVHHKIPFMQYDDPAVRREKAIYCDLADLMALCKQCHHEIHEEMRNNKRNK